MPHYFPRGNSDAFFQEHTWNSPITDLKYIGPWVGGLIRDALGTNDMPSAGQTIDYVLRRSQQVRRGYRTNHEALEAVVAALSLNRRLLECTPSGYMPGPVNRMAFNAIIDMIAYAKTHQHPFVGPARTFLNKLDAVRLKKYVICGWNEGTDLADGGDGMCDLSLPSAVFGQGAFAQALGHCPCKSQDDCTSDPQCRWVDIDGTEGCVVDVPGGGRYGKRWRGPRNREFATYARTNSQRMLSPPPEWNKQFPIYRHGGVRQLLNDGGGDDE
jgi:hypothetical protein